MHGVLANGIQGFSGSDPFAHEARDEQAERDAERARELEVLERATAAGVGQLLAGFQPINDTAELVERMKRAERYRNTLAHIWRHLDELDVKLGEGELHDGVAGGRRKEELLLASEVIEETKAIIRRMYLR